MTDRVLLKYEVGHSVKLADRIMELVERGDYSVWELRLALKFSLLYLDRRGFKYENEAEFDKAVREVFDSVGWEFKRPSERHVFIDGKKLTE